MVPAAGGTSLDDIGGDLALRLRTEYSQLLGGRHAAARRREPMPEHVRHDPEFGFLADRTIHRRLRTDISGRSDQLRVSVADLGSAESTEPNLIDEHPSGKPMIDNPAALKSTPERASGETHPDRVAIRTAARAALAALAPRPHDSAGTIRHRSTRFPRPDRRRGQVEHSSTHQPPTEEAQAAGRSPGDAHRRQRSRLLPPSRRYAGNQHDGGRLPAHLLRRTPQCSCTCCHSTRGVSRSRGTHPPDCRT